MKKPFLLSAGFYALVFFFSYVSFAFVALDINPTAWSDSARLAFAYLNFWFLACAGFLAFMLSQK